jgi:hypothetical protein
MKQRNNTTSLAMLRSKWFSKRTILTGLAALLTVGAQAQVTYTPVLTNVWVLPAATYADLPASSGNNVRGIAINPTTTNVLYASTAAGSNHVGIVSFASGSNYLGSLNAQTISAGTLGMEGVRVADDGTIYTWNLSGAPASRFLIFKWPTEATGVSPTVVFDSSTAPPSFQWRIGDYMDVRGSGANTEIVGVGSGSGANITTNFVVFRPTDSTCTTFTNFSITIPGSQGTTPVNLCGAGIAFEGTNNAVWIRQAGQQFTRRITYTPAVMSSGACARTNTVDQSVCQGLKYYASTNGVQLLATVQASTGNGANQIARVFQIPTSPTAPLVSVLSSNIPAVTGSVNGNSLGNVDVKNGYFAFGAPGHGISLFKLDFLTAAPPSGLTLGSPGSTIVEGTSVTFTATAAGSAPLTYQFYFTNATSTNLLASSTNNIYTNSSISVANIGSYFAIVTNLYGSATSGVANITVLPKGTSTLMTNLWTIAGGSRSYIPGSGNLVTRGLGYDPVLNRVLVVSRAPTNGVWILDANTGAEVGTLDLSLFNPGTPSSSYGTFAINMCGVADDGVVYGANLCNSATDPFAIYPFASATDGAPYTGTPAYADGGTLYSSVGRLGDTMAVRGAGTNTQILCASRNSGTNVVIFTTTDGVNFNPNIVAINTSNQEIGGLSVYWGAGNTFWAKTDSLNNVRQVSFDLTTLTGTVIGSYPLLTTETIIGVDSDNGYVTVVGARENPQTLGVYDINNISSTLPIDREFFAGSTAGANVQSTGQSVVDVKGGRVFSLSTGTGILAVKYAGKLAISQIAGQQVVTWPTTNAVLQSAAVVSGPYTDVSGATTPYTNSTGSVKFYRLRN